MQVSALIYQEISVVEQDSLVESLHLIKRVLLRVGSILWVDVVVLSA